MCGIVGYIGKRDVVGVLLDGLRRLEYRGYDSAGVALVDGGNIVGCKRVGKLGNLEEELTRHPLHGTIGIGHTRWATHGRPSDSNAHPHMDCSGRIAVIHNGIIENFAALRADLIGEHTIGRAAVQKLVKLPDGSGLWLSTTRSLTPAGTPLHEKGLDTTVAVNEPESADFGPPPTDTDTILTKAPAPHPMNQPTHI